LPYSLRYNLRQSSAKINNILDFPKGSPTDAKIIKYGSEKPTYSLLADPSMKMDS